MKFNGLKQLWIRAFDDSEAFADLFFSTAYSDQRCEYLEEDGHLAAALYWLDTEYAGQKTAYIYGVATDPEFRNRGLCRKLMERTHEKLRQQGYCAAILMPAKPELRQMYAKLGYRECSAISEFSCKAGSELVETHALSLPEYAALRRQYLPAGSVLQEGENLTYLATYAAFYGGEGFAMAAVHEKETLFVPELLGDSTKASGILKAMGYERGTFRTPGEDIPFTMWYPFQKDLEKPVYFGLAFD